MGIIAIAITVLIMALTFKLLYPSTKYKILAVLSLIHFVALIAFVQLMGVYFS